jgi:hypothetical protein
MPPGRSRARDGTSVRYTLPGDEAVALWLVLRDASSASWPRSSAQPWASTCATVAPGLPRARLLSDKRPAT